MNSHIVVYKGEGSLGGIGWDCGGQEVEGVWPREYGTICPFGAFPLFCSLCFVRFEANPCDEASCVGLFHGFAGIWAGCNLNSPFVQKLRFQG